MLKQTSVISSAYSADTMGVPSALYEMGGMVVMHDPSGCNSTYATHDEPRWYKMPSMVYISALDENTAVFGDDGKLINDICVAAEQLHPRFIAIAGTIIPHMIGLDIKGVSRAVEKKTGIPSFGFPTTSMQSYVFGANEAFATIAERFVSSVKQVKTNNGRTAVNLLGVTPLDFSVNGNVQAMQNLFEANGFDVISNWAMGCSWEKLMNCYAADVNVVVSSTGIKLAKILKKLFGTPYVVGSPAGKVTCKRLFLSVEKSTREGVDCTDFYAGTTDSCSSALVTGEENKIVVIGESLTASSIRDTLYREYGFKNVQVVSPLEFDCGVLSKNDVTSSFEEEISQALRGAVCVIADPLYKAIVGDSCRNFIEFPHEACSGRIYRDRIPIFIGEGLNAFLAEKLRLAR